MKRIGLTMLALVLSAGIMAGCAEQKKKAEKVEKEGSAQTEMVMTEKPAEAMEQAAPMAPAGDGQEAMDMAAKAEGEAAMVVEKAEEKVAEAAATMEKAVDKKMEETAAMAEAAKESAPDMKSVEAGAALYASKCSPCHGASGKGTPMAPSFIGNGWVKDASHAQVADVIKNGRSGAAKMYKKFVVAMPANKGLSDSDISALVDYLKSIN